MADHEHDTSNTHEAPKPHEPNEFSIEGSDLNLKQLLTAIKWSRDQMSQFRVNRIHAIKQYVGSHYSANGAPKHVPLNLIQLSVSIFSRQLVARRPHARVTTKSNELKPLAMNFKLALDHLIEEIDLEDTIREMVKEALFLVGVARSGLMAGGKIIQLDDETHDIGQPFVDVVHFDNFIIDMTASSRRDAQFIGDRFKIPLSRAKKLWPEHAKKLSTSLHERTDEGGIEHADEISNDGRKDDRSEFDPRIELTNVYLPHLDVPREIIFSEHIAGLPVLENKEWNGVETGPYHFLEFNKVPQQLLPVSPIANLIEIHDKVNAMARKMNRQAERQKTITAVQKGDSADGQIVMDSNDGDSVAIENPSAAQQLSFGGIDQSNFAWLVFLTDQYNRFAGNLDSLGGLGPQSETARQDLLLEQKASGNVQDMEYSVNLTTKGMINSIGFFLFHDPLIELPLTKRIADIEIPIVFSPSEMEGDFFEYNLNVEPLSMRPKTASGEFATLQQIMQTVVLPAMPFLQQEGLSVSFQKYLETAAELLDIPSLREIIVESNGEFLGGGVTDGNGIEAPRQAAFTSRENIRVNRPGSTQGGKNEALIQTLLGAGQPDSTASILRPTG